MVEKANAYAALHRSWELTEGRRLTILGMIFLIWLINIWAALSPPCAWTTAGSSWCTSGCP